MSKRLIQGKAMRVTRLDEKGNPDGDPVTINADVEFSVAPFELSVDLCEPRVDPDLLALLLGVKSPLWWRISPKWLRRRINRRVVKRLLNKADLPKEER